MQYARESISLVFIGLACCCALTAGRMRADEPAHAETTRELARRIDQHLQTAWHRGGVRPSGPAGDDEFLRRAYLDLVGTIPAPGTVQEFLRDPSPEKRFHLVDKLLASPRHATHLANTWRRILLPDGFPAERTGDAVGMHQWLRQRFAINQRYDRLVGNFITATGSSSTGPVLFYQAQETKPEKLAASTARSFLGVQIECAQCHDHPYDDWKQEDFWAYAAFFAQVDGQVAMGRGPFVLRDAMAGEVTLPEETIPVAPAFPGGAQPITSDVGTRRVQLSIWLASPENPFLARATANRVWWLLFGRGIVEPVDDFSAANHPSQPEVLEALAEHFVSTQYDLRELFRVVAYTDAYGLSSRANQDETPPPGSFARMLVKNLTTDQIFDAMVQALRNSSHFFVNGQPAIDLRNPVRNQFMIQMGADAFRPTEYTAGLQQSLLLMNNSLLQSIWSDPDHGLLAALQAPHLDSAERVRSVFLTTLSRYPDAEELDTFVAYLANADNDGASQTVALADMAWAMLNSAEFRLNH